jgi:hypothetical protein
LEVAVSVYGPPVEVEYTPMEQGSFTVQVVLPTSVGPLLTVHVTVVLLTPITTAAKGCVE